MDGGCQGMAQYFKGIFGRVYRYVPGVFLVVVPNLPKCRAPVLKSQRTYRRASYRHRVRTEPYRSVRWGLEAVPKHFIVVNAPGIPFPKCWVRVSSSYRTIPECSVGHGGRTEPLRYSKYPRYTLPAVPGGGIEVVPNLPRCWVPVPSS